MKEASCSQKSIERFLKSLDQYKLSQDTYVDFNKIKPVENLVHINKLMQHKIQASDLPKCAIIKLNGGLGTSMGCSVAKSSLAVKEKNTFLDIIAQSVKSLSNNIHLPLYFMNSFSTDSLTKALLEPYGSSLTIKYFLQSKVPRILESSCLPADFDDEHQNWNPPGHADVYYALEENGILDDLLNKGYLFAFISNSDNLGAQFEPKLLHYMSKHKLDMLMECTAKTDSDLKGGILCQHNNKLDLVECAQVKPNDLQDFYDAKRFKYFNTNNIWIHLPTLKAKLSKMQLKTQLIVNKKIVNGIPIVQLESAMGSAISCFENSKAIVVNRDRFLPVKTSADLLYLRSNAVKWENNTLSLLRKFPTRIRLSEHYKDISNLDTLIDSPLDLLDADSLTLDGAIKFGSNTKISGHVSLSNTSEDVIELEDNIHYDNQNLHVTHYCQRSR